MMGEAACCECCAADFVNANSGRSEVMRISHRVAAFCLLVNEWDKAERRGDIESHGFGHQRFIPPPLDFEVGEIICFPLLILDRMDWRKANAGGVAVAGMAPDLPRPDSQSIINNFNP